MPQTENKHQLPRTLGLVSLIIYGVGDMLGAGVYGLIGSAAGVMGNMVWAGFLVSAIAAGLTALTYASLGTRYPKAGGAAYIADKAFGTPAVSYILGLCVVGSGLISMAAAARAFASYAGGILPNLSPVLIVISFLVLLAWINFLGMRESSRMNILCTTIEVFGLLFLVAIGCSYWGAVDLFSLPKVGHSSVAEVDILGASFLLLQGAVLTFYAFLGFEDLLNISEEVKSPAKHFGIGIIAAVAITTILYLAVSITAVSVVPASELSGSTKGPLSLVVERAAPWLDVRIFSFVALFAIANTALLNFVMASRLIFGMARQKLLPAFFDDLHPRRRTPHRAILLIVVVVGTLVLSGDIAQLASATSLLLLLVFIVMNGALIRLKLLKTEPPGTFEIGYWIPISAIGVNIALIGARLVSTDHTPFLIAALFLGATTVLYFVSQTSRTRSKRS